jgi:secondary thiamine-phosphate synthase enzyme
MINALKKILLETKKQFEVVDITDHVKKAVLESRLQNGLVNIFCPHTTAAVRLNHNEPLLMQDIMKMLYRLAPVDINYSHDLFEVRQNVAPNERSNGHAHVKAFLLGSSESLPVEKGSLIIGAKQSIFFIELDGGRSREVYLKILGE